MNESFKLCISFTQRLDHVNACSWSFLKLWIMNILQYSRFSLLFSFSAIMKNAAVGICLFVCCAHVGELVCYTYMQGRIAKS